MSNFIWAQGLHIVPPNTSIRYSDDARDHPGCFISPIPSLYLRTWKGRYSDVLDPILHMTRSVYEAPYLTPGDIYWNDDVPALAAQTRPTFQKIARWIRKAWPKPEGDDCYFGPEARRLVFEEGIQATSMVPGVTFTRVPVRD